MVRAKERFQTESIYTDFTVEVQLKATSSEAVLDERDRYSFPLTVDHFDKLRDTGIHAQRLLVVLFLPEDDSRWLWHSEDSLVARRCAYWVSLWNAPASGNTTSQTVYIPRANRFSAESLRSVMAKASFGEKIPYEV